MLDNLYWSAYNTPMNKVQARMIASRNHSGFTSALYDYYRTGHFDFLGMLREINDALIYARNATARKELIELAKYVRQHK